MTAVIIPLGLFLLYLGFRVWGQPLDRDRVSYWQTSVQGLAEEPDVFFGQVYTALKDGLASRDVQLSGMGFGPTKLFETHSILSSRPLYLEARYKHLSYYLFLGQTPTGLFLSSRVYNKFVKGERSKGIVSYAALKYFQRQTMFQYDASIMFLESVHAIVLTVLDSYIEEKKLKPLEEYERRPILHAFYANAYPPKPQQMWAVPTQGVPMQSSNSFAPAPPTPDTGDSPVSKAPRLLPLEPDDALPVTTPVTATASETTDQIANEVAESSTRYDGTDDSKSDDTEIDANHTKPQAGDDTLSQGDSPTPNVSNTVQPAEIQAVHESSFNEENEAEAFEREPAFQEPEPTQPKTYSPTPEVEKPKSGRILPL